MATLESLYTAGRNVKWCSCWRKQYGSSSKSSIGLPYYLALPLLNSEVSKSVSCSVVSNSLWPHELQPTRLLSIGFPRQEYWSGLPCPSPEGLPHPGTKPTSPVFQADSLPSEPPGKPKMYWKEGFKQTHTNVHSSIIYNNQKVETTQRSKNSWMDL